MATLLIPPDSLWRALRPGDALLYQGRSLLSRAIRLKTWAPVSHIEVAMGHGIAYASRDGLGVRSYPVRRTELYAALRPVEPFDALRATAYHNTVAGQRYDTVGLFRFFCLGRQSTDKQFCSEYATRLYRAAGIFPFNQRYDADLVSPGMFLSSPKFAELWSAVIGS
jgi:hypothetical protein